MLFREAVLGRELEAAPPHLLVVLELRTAAIPAPGFHIVGEDAAQPERVVPEMRPPEKAPAIIRIVDVTQQVGERRVDLIVALTQAHGSTALPETHHERREIVRE